MIINRLILLIIKDFYDNMYRDYCHLVEVIHHYMIKLVLKWLLYHSVSIAKLVWLLIWFLFLRRKFGMSKKMGLLIYSCLKNIKFNKHTGKIHFN